ncbi:MAG: hypothetical protein A2784_00785 [Candidatus Chisholmbacteria bacterium RIFCSPHIGHO2_01_FULL_48_12]|uniref:PEGA domain-containing protein n=1 Tax=Candidatus Chisholmbacteria bacterium RIFCSPHIGHO2_01_FULL_48_12 TaxID=1797589 RepID=A0A1G1VKL6_9BACT|nr:MAG: hypothetical protein A2784_00785 [Candidatus Chisholmbacteria bacterium RIFCSPHIGHO2_01_FULL_48_12]
MSRRLILSLLSLLVISLGTFAAIKFAQGYRPSFGGPQALKGTGLLVANSFPSGAQVFLNGKLTTATDDTLNLPPGDYQVDIKKDGFHAWSKRLKLEPELVTQTNATLFPAVPTLRPLTFSGALNPLPSPDGQKIAYVVTASANPTQTGLWVLELTQSPSFLRKDPRQIARNNGLDFSIATLAWSPDSSQILVHLDKNNFLLDATRFNDNLELKDVTARLTLILSDWEERLAKKQLQQLLTLPLALPALLLESATNLYFSPDETKLLYTATKDINLPQGLLPPLPASSTQNQQRQLAPNATYVYDLKEDKNFLVSPPPPAELGNEAKTPPHKILLVDSLEIPPTTSPSALPAGRQAYTKLQDFPLLIDTLAALTAQYTPLPIQPLQWFPTSSHLIAIAEGKITVLEYDGLNQTTIFSGTFRPGFAYPAPNGSQMIILTNLNQDSDLPPNLYSIDLK